MSTNIKRNSIRFRHRYKKLLQKLQAMKGKGEHSLTLGRTEPFWSSYLDTLESMLPLKGYKCQRVLDLLVITWGSSS